MPDQETWLLALAEHVGRHALAWYVGLLAALLLLAVPTVGWLQRRGAPALPDAAAGARGWSMPPVFVVNLAFGFALVAAAAAGFAALADGVTEGGTDFGAFDDRLSRSLAAALPRGTLQAFAWVTHLGDREWLFALGFIVGIALLLARQTALAWFWALSVAGNGLLVRLLKALFERVRPVHEHGLALEDGWSFPSGHTSGAIVAYGLLAWLVWRLAPRCWRLPAVLAAVAIAFTVGYSRVVLQVHHATDVLAGWASGGSWLIVSIVSAELARRAGARRRRDARREPGRHAEETTP